MSDTCTMWIEFRKEDRPVVAKTIPAWGDEQVGKSPESIRVHFDEANYAWQDAREKLAAAKVPFFGGHGAGGDYGCGLFASCDGSMMETEAGHDGGLVVRVGSDGKPAQGHLNYVHRFMELQKKATAVVLADEMQKLVMAVEDEKRRKKSAGRTPVRGRGAGVHAGPRAGAGDSGDAK